ncbi:unnamed protein product, partial [Ectocarpus sp. 12 AP-2014]
LSIQCRRWPCHHGRRVLGWCGQGGHGGRDPSSSAAAVVGVVVGDIMLQGKYACCVWFSYFSRSRGPSAPLGVCAKNGAVSSSTQNAPHVRTLVSGSSLLKGLPKHTIHLLQSTADSPQTCCLADKSNL